MKGEKVHINPEKRRVEIALNEDGLPNQGKLVLSGGRLGPLFETIVHAPHKIRGVDFRECDIHHVHLNAGNEALFKINREGVNSFVIALFCPQCGLRKIVPRKARTIIELANMLEFNHNFSI